MTKEKFDSIRNNFMAVWFITEEGTTYKEFSMWRENDYISYHNWIEKYKIEKQVAVQMKNN
jgi:hypothetical protein